MSPKMKEELKGKRKPAPKSQDFAKKYKFMAKW